MQEPAKKKALGYCRVSTKTQAEEGTSLETQEERIHAFCTLKRWELVDVLKDEESGASVKRLTPLLARLKQERAQVLVVERVDRLTRLDPADFQDRKSVV